jgi:hypothetical protein
MFIPLSHVATGAQRVDFEADGYDGGKAPGSIIFVRTCHSRTAALSKPPTQLRRLKPSVMANVAAVLFGENCPNRCYDNTRLAVAKIVKGGQRLRSQMFAELQSHYLFEDRFWRVKGNDKGKVGLLAMSGATSR